MSSNKDSEPPQRNELDTLRTANDALTAQVQTLTKQLEQRTQQTDLLKGILTVLEDDLQLKTEQYGYLFSNLQLNPVWQGMQRPTIVSNGNSRSPSPPRPRADEPKGHSRKMSRRNFPYINTMSQDVQAQMVRYLDYTELSALSGTCKHWTAICNNNELWSFIFHKRWPRQYINVQRRRDALSSSAESKSSEPSLPRSNPLARTHSSASQSSRDSGLTTKTYDSYFVNDNTWRNQFSERIHIEQNWNQGKANVVTLAGHKGSVTSLEFDGDGRLVTGSDDGSVILWKMVTRHNTNRSQTATNLMQQHHMQSTSGRTHKTHTFHGHGGPVWSVSFRGDTLASGSYDKTIKLWSMKGGQCLTTLRGHSEWVACVEMCNNGRLISGGWDASVKLWQIGRSMRGGLQGHCLATLNSNQGNAIYCVESDLENDQIISGCRNQAVQLWDVNRGVVKRTYMGHSKQIYDVQKSDRVIHSASGDQTVKTWDARTAECVGTLSGHHGPIMSCQADNYKVVTGSYDKQIKIWDVRTRSCVHTLSGHAAAIFAVQFDHQHIVSGSADTHALIWNFSKS